MSIIETDSGFLAIDPLLTASTAHAGMELVYQYVGQKPIVAVIYTHSHIDHWGGVKGVISEAERDALTRGILNSLGIVASLTTACLLLPHPKVHSKEANERNVLV